MTTNEKNEEKLLNLLKTIEGTGSFATSNSKESILPGLVIDGVGEVGLPISPVVAKELIKQAQKASFGKGSKTVLDTTVRSVWEIDAKQLSFQNKKWQVLMQEIVEEAKIELGLQDKEIKPSLYKLLVYEAGDFFLPHKDSEKEKGMFGTLVVNLPSKHEGGALVVRFDGREKVIDFSKEDNYTISYAAFFADCEHELRKVTAGYRVCLVYNLLFADASKSFKLQTGNQVDALATVLQEMAKEGFDKLPKVVMLDHEYTQTNFSLSTLKLNDLPRAEALLEAAEKAGFFAKLALITHYQMGDWEVDYDSSRYKRRRYRDYDDDDDEEDGENGSMGEIFEEYTHIEYWATDGLPDLGTIDISEELVIGDIELAEGEPSEKSFEGFTGNAGMTMEYWYHYGAVILWPKSKHAVLLQDCPVEVQLDWMAYFLEHWESPELASSAYVWQVLANFSKREDLKKRDSDFSILTAVLEKIQDPKFIAENCLTVLVQVFDKIRVHNWAELLQYYPADFFDEVFLKVGFSEDLQAITHLFKVLENLQSQNAVPAFVAAQIEQIPEYLSDIKFHKKSGTEKIQTLLNQVLAFSRKKEKDQKWIKEVLTAFIKNLERDYVNQALVPVLLKQKEKGLLFQELYQACTLDLMRRVNDKPQPLPNWTREVPTTDKYNQKFWEMLTPFLQSPTQQDFDYAQIQKVRSDAEHIISRANIDLEMTTIKKGSPHTLRLTKTNAAYLRELKKWKEDEGLLEKLKGDR